MNINLIYEGKDYNFDIPNGVTIDYLKELSSRIFNSDKALLDLVYNNQKIENKDDNVLIRDLIPEGETNTILTVQINKDTNNSTKDEIIPLVSLKTKTFNNIDNKKESNNIEDNKDQNKNNKEKDKNNKKESKKKIINKSLDKDILHNMKNNKNNRSKLIIDTNKNNINVIKKDFDIKSFQSNFLRKNKELLELIKEFNNKIKDVYLSLYKKYKNTGGNNNNISSFSNNSSISSISTGLNNNYFYELSIYEKKIMNFEENQINYYRTLLELIKNYEKKKDILQLNDFYAYLIINNNNIGKSSKDKNIDPIKYLKFKKLLNNKLLINDTLRNNNLSTLNINNNNHLPLLKNRSINSSLNLEKKNIYFNNISGINSYQNKNQINNIKTKQVIDEMKEKNQIINNINKGLKTSKIKKGSLLIENKSIINNNVKSNILNDNNNENNNNEKNNNNTNNGDNNNNNNNNTNTNNSNTNSSINIDELSEKDLVNDIDINKNTIAPIPLQIRNSLTTNIVPRKFSMINNNIIRNRNNSIFSNHLNSGLESIDRGNEEKSKQKYPRFSSLNFQNKLNSPKKKITINDNSPNKSKRKGLNDSMNENGLVNTKKIKEIDVSSMTVNDSNFIRDKQKGLKMKNNKDMNKYDFFM